MPFYSILNAGLDDISATAPDIPAFFKDLNLDQIVETITVGRDEYDLRAHYYRPVTSVAAVEYRHEVFRDLAAGDLRRYVESFAREMRSMRSCLVQVDKLHYKYQKEAWFLDAVQVYCGAVGRLVDGLALSDVKSSGFRGFHEYLRVYTGSLEFASLLQETNRLREDLAKITYCLHIQGNRIRVSEYEEEADYSAEVEATFRKFRQGAAKDHLVKFPNWGDLNHVEAAVLDLVARLNAGVFLALDTYYNSRRDYLDRTIADFDREVQFYLAYVEYMERFESADLRFCYPHVSEKCKEVAARDTFDVALAAKLTPAQAPVVCNGFYLHRQERIFIVSGANQSGKTTFARTFGQLHYLASLGCPVPGTQARLFLFDRLFTHFEQEEDPRNLSGKLQDELIRIHEILAQATPNSIIILNEIFTSTTLCDALSLSRKVLEQITRLELLCVCVTFVDELATLNDATVSMVGSVEPQGPAAGTFKIVRRPADGLSYAAAVAEKYGLTYRRLRERIGP